MLRTCGRIIGAAGLSAPLLLPMFGMMLSDEIIPEWWATSSRNGGRDHLEMMGGIIPESKAVCSQNPQRDST
jgi:hypothetical protein